MSLTFALQALLVRHESHLVEAEAERLKMGATIDKLEHEKKGLEESNAKVIAENRELLDQLEDINNKVCESDTEIQALTATLYSTNREIQKLNTLADRATELETQLINMELEHADLQTDFTNSQEQNKNAVQRWKRAEGTINYLQDQIDKIEREAKEERERHVEVLGRLERRRAVEKELEHAAGRLKDAAAAKSLGAQTHGSNVVSHFVRDILQDNANLQMGVVELREMLQGSNSEVENLREQLLLHQPVEADVPTLSSELGTVEASTFKPIPELHVHHHYHQAEKTVKKPKKKRTAITPNHFTPSGASTPRQQRVREWRTSTSSANTILSQTSVTVPPNRWSMQSTQTGLSFAPSSIPSSPRRSNSIFDPMDSVFDSRPTSPETSVFSTSPPQTKPGRRPSADLLAGHRSVSTPAPSSTANVPLPEQQKPVNLRDVELGGSLPEHDLLPSPHETIPEEVETDDGMLSPGPSTTSFSRLRHRRAASHESLFSLAGEIARPLRRQQSYNFDITGRGFSPVAGAFSPTTSSFSVEPTVSHATATAKKVPRPPTKKQESNDSARSLLSHASSTPPNQTPTRKSKGAWAWGKWGKMPLPNGSAKKSAQSPIEAAFRSPGINQSGFVKGLGPPKPTPVDLEPKTLDESSLREAMAG